MASTLPTSSPASHPAPTPCSSTAWQTAGATGRPAAHGTVRPAWIRCRRGAARVACAEDAPRTPASEEEAMTQKKIDSRKAAPAQPAMWIRGSLTPELKPSQIPSPVMTELVTLPRGGDSVASGYGICQPMVGESTSGAARPIAQPPLVEFESFASSGPT